MGSKLTIGSILSTLGNILFALILSVLAILTLSLLLLQTVYFQNLLAQKALDQLNEQTKEQVSLSKIKIKWFDAVVLKGLEVTDYNDNVMVKSRSLSVNYDLMKIINSGKIKIDQIELSDAEVNLRNYDDSLGINLLVLVDELSGPKKEKKEKKDTVKTSPRIKLDHLYLENVALSYVDDQSEKAPAGKMDFANLNLVLGEVIIEDFVYKDDSIKVGIRSFDAKEQNSGFAIQKWETDVLFTPQSLLLDNLDLRLTESRVGNRILIEYEDFSAFSDFMNAVSMDLELRNVKIDPDDFSPFVDLDKSIPPIDFEGDIKGRVSSLSIQDMSVTALGRTYIKGSVDIFGLPNIEESFIDFAIKDADVYAEDFNELLDGLPEETGVKHLEFSGRFSGFIHDFVAKLDLTTGQGRLVSDLNLKIPKNWEDTEYSGRINVTNFNVGAFINNRQLVQEVNFKGFIKGKGLTVDKANFYTEAELVNSGIYGYQYESIKAKGEFASKYFDGSLTISDPNIKLFTQGTIDLAHKPERINVKSEIEKINFLELGLAAEDFRLSTNIDFELLGLNLDSLSTDARIENVQIGYEEKELSIDSIIFSTHNSGLGRDISFSIPEVQGRVTGNFVYSELTDDLITLAEEVTAYMEPGSSKDSVFREYQGDGYKLQFDLTYGDLTDYIRFFTQRLYISPGQISGQFIQRKNATLSLSAEVDSLYYDGVGLSDNNIDLNASVDYESHGITALVYLASQDQFWRAIPNTSGLEFEAVWQNDHLDIDTKIRQPETDSRASVSLGIDFYEDNISLGFDPSLLRVFGDDWHFGSNNRIDYDGATIIIDQLDLTHEDQVIAIGGIYSDSLATDISLMLRNFHLHNLSTVVPVKLEGYLNSELSMFREEGEALGVLSGSVDVRDLFVDDVFVGDIIGNSNWNESESRLGIDFNIKRESINTIKLVGDFYPDKKRDQLDMKLSFDEANLVLISPFLVGTISDLKGLADGQITIKGETDNPLLDGYCQLKEVKFTYDYLGVTYLADGRIEMGNESINIKGINLRDKDNNKASLSGMIYHNSFSDIRPDIHLSTKRFLFLNTPSTTGELYYGNAYASGTVDVSGSLDDLLIAAKMRSEKGTRIYLPLMDGENVEQKDYIIFRNFNDTTQTSSVDEVIRNSISGVRLDFDMEITPDAYVEMIFDKRAGDIIRGSAYGNLNLLLDTSGDFELFGAVTIVEGGYNFTSSIKGKTFLAKEFSVESGSTITWYGDPLTGELDLRAIYRQMASLSDYKGTTGEEGVSNQRLPVLVVLSLTGEMLAPTIGFELRLDDSQSLASPSDKAEILAINNNDQELKTQVFSLLMLKKFSPKGDFNMQGGAAAVSSLSEFVSNQLSYYASQFNENLQIDLDLSSTDQNAPLDAVQLQLSYSFLDGRLKVSGGAGFNQQNNQSTADDNNNSFIGDWSVRYLLTPDGRLRARAFSQNESIAGVQQRETGVSLQIVKSFDDLRELMKTSKIRELIRRREDEDVTPETTP